MLKYGDLLSGLCEVGDEGQVCGSPHPVWRSDLDGVTQHGQPAQGDLWLIIGPHHHTHPSLQHKHFHQYLHVYHSQNVKCTAFSQEF